MAGYKIQTDSGWVTAARVTEVVRSGMPSPALERWKLRGAVDYALRNPMMVPDADESIKKWNAESRGAADRGSSVHKLIAAYLTARDRRMAPLPDDDAIAGYWNAWHAWWQEVGSTLGEVRGVEQVLLSGDMKVAGTADALLGDCLLDWKTSSTGHGPAWPDQIAQIGAYASMAHRVRKSKVVGNFTPPQEARIVRLCPEGTYSEHVVEGADLRSAKMLWASVRLVAAAVRA